MAINCTWTINNMTHKDADGDVTLVYWSCVASDGKFSATEGGKLRCEADPSSPDYVPYDKLTEEIVLGWVYASLVEGEETPEEAKARVEADRSAKVQKQIDRANSESSGMPWANAS